MSIHCDNDGPVAVITIDRPEVANAIDAPSALELADGFRRFDADEAASLESYASGGWRAEHEA
jgi:enoyl-CoA hydratase